MVGALQHHGKIITILPAFRRNPISFEICFSQPDVRTGETNNVVIPSVNRRGRCLIFACRREVAEAVGGGDKNDPGTKSNEVPMIENAVIDSEGETEPLCCEDLTIDSNGTVYTVGDFPVKKSVSSLQKSVSALVFSPAATKKSMDNTPAPGKKRKRNKATGRVRKRRRLYSKGHHNSFFNTSLFRTLSFQVEDVSSRLGEYMFAKVMGCVTMGVGLRKVGKLFVYAFGFLTDIEMRTTSLVSCNVSILANRFGWGVDSDKWRCRPIYFSNNIESDGLQ